MVKAQQRRALFETSTRRDGVMNVQLSIAALEIAAPNPGL
jgi:hypothetical protein